MWTSKPSVVETNVSQGSKASLALVGRIAPSRVFKMSHPLCSPPPGLPSSPCGGAGGLSAAEVRAGARVFKISK